MPLERVSLILFKLNKPIKWPRGFQPSNLRCCFCFAFMQNSGAVTPPDHQLVSRMCNMASLSILFQDQGTVMSQIVGSGGRVNVMTEAEIATGIATTTGIAGIATTIEIERTSIEEVCL